MSKIKFYKDSAKTQQVYPELDPEDITKFESIEDIENAFPNVSGEDTNLTLNHTVEAPMRLELAPSELEQETTTGKQLFDYTKINSVSGGTNNNGVITTTNKSNEGANVNIHFSNDGINIQNGDTIYFSADIKLNSGSSGTWNNINDGVNGETTKILQPTLSTTYQRFQTSLKYSNDTIINKIYLQFFSVTGTIEISNIMISKNSNADFEPYTGGFPQPNPDFPSQVHSVSGDNEIRIVNKNLLNKEIYELGKYIGNNGVITGNIQNFLFSNYERVKSNSEYTIGANAEMKNFVIAEYDKDKNWIKNTIKSAIKSATFRTGNNTLYVRVSCNYNYQEITKEIIDTLDIQLEEGVNKSSYVPHQEQSLPLNLPVENLFDKDNANVFNAYISAGGTITANTLDRTIWLPIKTNTDYTFQMTQKALSTSTSQDDIRITLFNTQPIIGGTGTIEYSVSRPSATSDYYLEKTFNSGNNTYVAIKILNIQKSSYDNTIATIQLEEGTKANAYTPYGTTPLEYCKIGTYSDEFFKNDPSDPNYDSSLELDRWYLKKNIGKVVLDGSENWASDGTLTNTRRYKLLLNNCKKNHANNLKKSNYFKYLYNYGLDEEHFYINDLGYLYIFSTQKITDDFKTWLSTHNTKVYYVLETPQYILLSDTLQHQLDDIYNWVESYPGQTNISQINNDLPFIISARAMKDLSVIDKYPTENSEHLVESGGVYEVINDINEVQDEHTAQIKALERASLIYNAMPKTTATGTDLTINDTAESPLKMSLGASELEQETTTGKNLFDGVFRQGSEATELNTQNVFSKNDLVLKPGTYTISTNLPLNNYKYAVGTSSSVFPGNASYINGFHTTSSFTFTINEELHVGILINKNNADITLSEVSKYTIQIEKGSSATDYEPYTGGQPSPSPDYPSQVHTISGDNEIVVGNDNLFSEDDFITAMNPNILVSKTIIDNEEVLYVNPISGTSMTYKPNLKPNTQYTLTLNIASALGSGDGEFNFDYSDGTSTYQHIGSLTSTYKTITKTSTSGKTLVGIRFRFYNVGDNKYYFKNIMLNEGTTVTPYTPYEEQPLPLNLPVENLFNINNGTNYNIDSGSISIIDNKVRATNLGIGAGHRGGMYLGGDELLGKTITLSAKWDDSHSDIGKINIITSDNSGGNRTVLGSLETNGGSLTLTLPNSYTTGTQFTIAFYTNHSSQSAGVYVDYFDIQVEKGTKANHYTPYGTTPIELCKIGDYKDYFYKSGGKWYKHKEIGKYKFTQYTSFAQNWNRNPDYTTYCLIRRINSQLGKNAPAICNILPLVDSIYAYDKIGIYQEMNDNGRLIFRVPKTIASSIEEFQSWLVNNDMITYTPIAPIEEEITDPTLISQLEDISMAISYQTQTNIFQSNNDLPFNIEATAVLDLNTLINAIVSLGGNI